ncbi:MAG: Hsp20/alpha crystallin family protein [Thermodesulfovibrionales bacterium]|nr:Hsp20/alpha crystallin family protein [Thermodesulfovibrionales bacterium]
MSIKSLIKKPFSRESVPVQRDDNPFLALHREINSLFENFFKDFDVTPFGQSFEGFSPKIDVVDSDKDIKITAELPGMDEKDIDVSVTKNAVTIKGEKKVEKEDKGKDYYRMERSYGSFCRTIPLPVEVNLDKAEAKFSKGILTINLPKTETAIKETKKIAIKAE